MFALKYTLKPFDYIKNKQKIVRSYAFWYSESVFNILNTEIKHKNKNINIFTSAAEEKNGHNLPGVADIIFTL